MPRCLLALVAAVLMEFVAPSVTAATVSRSLELPPIVSPLERTSSVESGESPQLVLPAAAETLQPSVPLPTEPSEPSLAPLPAPAGALVQASAAPTPSEASAEAAWTVASREMDGAAGRGGNLDVSPRYADPVIDALVARHLPSAIRSGRRVGLEIEFYGPNRETVMRTLRREFGGEFDLGLVRFDASAPVRKKTEYVYTRAGSTTDLKLTIADDGQRVSYTVAPAGAATRSFGDEASAHAYAEQALRLPLSQLRLRWPEEHTITLSGRSSARTLDVDFEWSALNHVMVGGGVRDRFEDYAAFAAQVERWRTGANDFFHGSTKLVGSTLGDLTIKNEGAALELVMPPLTHAHRADLRRLVKVLKSLGAHDGPHDVGIHVNITVDKENPEEMRRLILAYDAIRLRARREFRPHKSREFWLGAQNETLLARLADPSYRPTLAEFRELVTKNAKDKKSDLNMNHAARAYGRPAAEFRLFNLDFDRVDDMIDFALALAHSVSTADSDARTDGASKAPAVPAAQAASEAAPTSRVSALAVIVGKWLGLKRARY